jgi:parallel beta-helix repeat protein
LEKQVKKQLSYAIFVFVSTAVPALSATLVVDSDGQATPANCSATTVTPYTTIQAAITAAAAGDTVVVCPGTGPYDEQPVVDKPLRISGRLDATVRPSPMVDNTTSLSTGNPIAAGILVMDTTGVVVESLAVDGTDNGGTGCADNPVGIYFRNASGTVDNAAVRNMRLGPGLEGCQGGLGILVQSGGEGSASVLVQDTSVHAYQKNGITASGAATTLTARRNRVTGLGPTPHIAQNGIQVSFGATGSVENNTIANHVWTGCTPEVCSWVSTNVLVFEAADGLQVRANSVVHTQVGIYIADTNAAVVQGNAIAQTSPYDGIAVFGDLNMILGNDVTNSAEAGIFLDGEGNTVRRNRINEAPIGIWNFSGLNTVPTTGLGRNTTFNVTFATQTGSGAAARGSRSVRSARAAASSPAR